MSELRRAHEDARAIAREVTGRDPGPMTAAPSMSHYVYVGGDVAVKIIDARDHARLDRETALAAHLPPGISAAMLGAGRRPLGAHEIRWACYTRVRGTAPAMGLPGVDEPTALGWAGQAIERLQALHSWTPAGAAAPVLRETLDHGSFVTREALQASIARTPALDVDGVVPRRVLDALAAIADGAPDRAATDVPVHADCHWANWMVDGPDVTALLDFEWARYGEPLDDWFFLIAFSGTHREAVLDLVARTTGTPLPALRAACELRNAAYLVDDLLKALAARDPDEAGGNLRMIDTMITERTWW